MAGGKAHARKRVTATRGRQIAGRQPVKPAPAHPTLLTAPPQRAPPVSRQRPTKALQRAPVSRHPVVLKIASYHPPQPLPGLARRGVHPRPKLFLDFRRLRPHPLSHRLAPNHKASALPVDLADVRESQKVEGLRLPFPTASPVSDRPASELHFPLFGLPHAIQSRGHDSPLLRADRAGLDRVLLGAVASLPILRRR